MQVMTIIEYKAHIVAAVSNLRRKPPSPSAFAEAAQLIDVLAHATTPPTRSNGARFQEFVRDYVGSSYTRFRYLNGRHDLPEQMYAILRSGLVHTLSLTPLPHPRGRTTVGRRDSILISADGRHLAPITSRPYDAALFVFGTFLDDIETALQKAFLAAAGATPQRILMESHIRNHKPAVGLPPLTFFDTAYGTSITATASGTPWP
jgi:hypothetical protein